MAKSSGSALLGMVRWSHWIFKCMLVEVNAVQVPAGQVYIKLFRTHYRKSSETLSIASKKHAGVKVEHFETKSCQNIPLVKCYLLC